ncbi:FKBP-type peptidyl-prolyl cis-trans isomerase [Draconibacterium sp. IB214405]|uniref:FKBP-type peptidyl-prolyl cis-trans isomerase n=1 Tax=Draconibacterium sp. IB214405 TaxID=3097352 RepID=UPI002A0B6703|nr:FKBP-type peptidyl-prolyl cis-trans isomerase [Draconibacterium sp. IB214405]MDX8339811.1 FKBP-type peptidyl-prolyl cis-trans isomerase [Draconibacterium sp. IB214405]
MNWRLVTRFLLAIIIGVVVVSCIEEGEEYIPPTQAEEDALLSEYLDTLQNRGLDIDTTALGVYYVIDSVGNGTYPVIGDTCEVMYTGFFIDGSVFDSTGDNTWEFELGDEGVIPGWTDGMQVIDEGGRAFLIIPSELAYGTTGYGSVPPNTSLVFVVDMVEIKPLD